MRFDTAYLVSCRDVTTEEYAEANPHQRLVEARFHITALVADGESSAHMQYVYRLASPTGNVQIVDYDPHTQQSTAVAGNVSIEKKKETSKSLGISVSGSFESILRGHCRIGSRIERRVPDTLRAEAADGSGAGGRDG